MTISTPTLADAEALAASFLERRRALHADFRMEAADDADDTDDGADDGSDDSDDDSGNQETPEEKAARLEQEIADLKRHSRKHEDRAKANKDAADELARLKAAGMGDAEKLTAAEARAQAAEASLARYKVASETGLPADLLVGKDEDEMREYAEKLQAFKGKEPTARPDHSQGPRIPAKTKSAADIGREEARRRHPKP